MKVKRFFSYFAMVLMAPGKGLYWVADEELYAIPSVITACLAIFICSSVFIEDWAHGNIIIGLIICFFACMVSFGAVFGLYKIFEALCRILCYGPAALYDRCKRYIEISDRYIAVGGPEKKKAQKQMEKQRKQQEKQSRSQEKEKTLQYFIDQDRGRLHINF
ncbi:hypothetical protein [Eubacterium ramulus]|uniref:hypothetical protein n=1 Tax=Eubacterium ramulus TaxID=39490 RepID=UPI0022E6AE48|nr:hypothetical protein [Eubacterium ramulus]